MINHLKIENFKSIRSLDLPLKRVNILIGDTSSGKSNIIEAASLLSMNIMREFKNREIVRYDKMEDLFYDSDIKNKITITAGSNEVIIEHIENSKEIKNETYIFTSTDLENTKRSFPYSISPRGEYDYSKTDPQYLTVFRTYIYKRLHQFTSSIPILLNPPFGDNLPQILRINSSLQQFVTDVLKSKGYELALKSEEIQYAKLTKSAFYLYPYVTLSDTLARYIFMMSALKTNNDAFLIFDEPEANSFPFYIKHVAERIALDESNNQFMLTTHNPYFLMALMAKIKPEDLNLCVTRLENYETKVYPIPSEYLEKVVDYDSDIFFNLDRLIESIW